MKKIVLSAIFVAATAASLSAASFAACATCHRANGEENLKSSKDGQKLKLLLL